MSEKEQDPKLPDPVEEPPQPVDSSQPGDLRAQLFAMDEESPTAAEMGAAAGSVLEDATQPEPPASQGPDYVAEIRQQLSSEGEREREGGFLRRITGPLRRVTGPLRRRGETPAEEPPDLPTSAAQQPPAVDDMPDAFLSGRLGGASADAPAAPTPDQIELPPSWLRTDDAAAAPSLFAGEDALSGGLDYDPFAVEEDPLLSQRMGGGQFGEAAPLAENTGEGGEPDWMAQIRSGNRLDEPSAPEATPEPPAEKPHGRSGALSFITGILHGEGRRHPEEESLPDDLVTGRLERSLGLSAEEPPADAVPLFAMDDQPLFAPDQNVTLFDDLDVFAPPGSGTETPPLEITAEDERLLWGDSPQIGPVSSSAADGPTLRPEDIWVEPSAEAPPAAEPEPPARRPGQQSPTIDELYAASFLTGSAMPDVLPQGYSQDQLLREALEQAPGPEEIVSLEEIRSVALEGYQEGAADFPEEVEQPEKSWPEVSRAEKPDPAILAQEAAATAVQARVLEAWEEQEEAPPFSLRPSAFGAWLRRRTVVEKLLLAEAVLVAAALLFAVPFFLFLINRGPVYQSGYLIPRPLPADLPYPTRVDLPGGWSFPLERSTFVAGRWKPASPEWLEGTELRRVVALPWNPQTEAVIHTFQEGDQILVKMSNGDTVDYTVTSVERVNTAESDILSDTRPSLVLILYREKADERWVVFCKP